MVPVLAPQELYKHPDGFGIDYAQSALVMTDDNDNFVIVPIGRLGLLELAKKLYDIGMRGQ